MKLNPLDNHQFKDIDINTEKIEGEAEKGDKVLCLVTSTKPDFYKQAPVLKSAQGRFPIFVIHTGQHYDRLLGYGLKEYGLEEEFGANLNVRGDLSTKTGELAFKLKTLSRWLHKEHEDKQFLPIVHGDTLAAGVVPQAWMFATSEKVIHNEAGLRGMSPSYENWQQPSQFFQDQLNGDWKLDRSEPFPEQYNTFVGSAASQYHLAPVELNKKHLLREGYPEENVGVVGNSIIDAISIKSERGKKEEKGVFDAYPALEKRENWIRVDLHRRANLLPRRFQALMGAVIDLVESDFNVNLIAMNATKNALKKRGLRSKIEQLAQEKDNFLLTELWKKHSWVYEFLQSGQCFAELTDSGSMQEELNEIDGAISLTARFNTDRPETVFKSGSNLLVPPISKGWVSKAVKTIYEDEGLKDDLTKGEKLYGAQVGDKIIDFLQTRLNEDRKRWSHEFNGFDGGKTKVDYL